VRFPTVELTVIWRPRPEDCTLEMIGRSSGKPYNIAFLGGEITRGLLSLWSGFNSLRARQPLGGKGFGRIGLSENRRNSPCSPVFRSAGMFASPRRPHSALRSLRPIDYYCGDPEARVAERRQKLQ